MKKPYISLYIEEYPLQKNSNLFYDNETQINYIDEFKNQIAVNYEPPDTTTETRAVENTDIDFKGPDTTRLTETVENTDVDFYEGPPTTRQTYVVENSDQEAIIEFDTTRTKSN